MDGLHKVGASDTFTSELFASLSQAIRYYYLKNQGELIKKSAATFLVLREEGSVPTPPTGSHLRKLKAL